jgi:hypothetical protein
MQQGTASWSSTHSVNSCIMSMEGIQKGFPQGSVPIREEPYPETLSLGPSGLSPGANGSTLRLTSCRCCGTSCSPPLSSPRIFLQCLAGKTALWWSFWEPQLLQIQGTRELAAFYPLP